MRTTWHLGAQQSTGSCPTRASTGSHGMWRCRVATQSIASAWWVRVAALSDGAQPLLRQLPLPRCLLSQPHGVPQIHVLEHVQHRPPNPLAWPLCELRRYDPNVAPISCYSGSRHRCFHVRVSWLMPPVVAACALIPGEHAAIQPITRRVFFFFLVPITYTCTM
jgi:hypothetical protein